MNCRRIQELIPLFIEGDLKAGKAGPVRSHLEGCPDCAQVASEYRGSQQWLKSYTPPDFEESFFDGLRRGVHREIDATNSRAFRFRRLLALSPASFALASVAVFGLFFGLAFYLWPDVSDETPPYLLGDAGIPQLPGLDAGAPSDIDWKLPAADPSIDSRAERPRRQRRGGGPGMISRGPNPSLEPVEPLAVEAAPSREVLRIEFQTGDPNIRIIWFAPAEANAGDSKRIISVETE